MRLDIFLSIQKQDNNIRNARQPAIVYQTTKLDADKRGASADEDDIIAIMMLHYLFYLHRQYSYYRQIIDLRQWMARED